MNKKNIFITVILLLSHFLLPYTTSLAMPVLIEDCDGLLAIRDKPNEQYKLLADINCENTDMNPIPLFHGTLDGNNYSINNIHLIVEDDYVNTSIGVFANVMPTTHLFYKPPTITNLSVNNLYINSTQYLDEANIGGLVGYAVGAVLDDIHMHNAAFTLEADISHIGGIVGKVEKSSVSNSAADVRATVFGTANMLGGIIGTATDSHINNTHSKINAIAEGDYTAVGGAVGHVDNTLIQQSWASGKIVFDGYESAVGGLAGELLSNSQLQNSYATTKLEIEGDYHFIGGLVGGLYTPSSIDNAYAIGEITASPEENTVGGLIGSAHGYAPVNNSYWDTHTTGQTDSDGGEPRTTAQMLTQDNYIAWNFDSIWAIEEGERYPWLK